jgi:acetyl esterase/lipase
MRIPTLVWTFVLTACTNVTEQVGISYDDRYSVDVLDVYTPAPSGKPRPAVLVIHGGGWTEGIYRSSMAQFAERLAEAGYVTVNIEYRLTPDGGQYPHEVQDCYCALAWMRGHTTELGIDPVRIAGLGYSAGGHLVSMLGVDTDADVMPDCAQGTTGPLNAVVSGAGPEDMTKLPQVSAVIDFVGGTIDQIPQIYRAASPITHVGPGAPPYLFVHGDDDWFVDFDAQMKPMQAALAAVGTETRVLEIPGGGHIWNRPADGGEWEVPLTSLETPEAEAALFDFLEHTIGAP